MIAASVAAVCWTLAIEPATARRTLGVDSLRIEIGRALFTSAAVATALACGLALVTVVRAASPRAPLGTAALGLSVTGLTGAALLVGICEGTGTEQFLCSVGYAAGLLAVALGARQARGTTPARSSRSGALPLGAAAVAIGAQLVRLPVFGPADDVSVTLAALVAGALAVRQAAALRDLRRYGDEAAAREARFRALAHTDALTGLANRRRLVQVLRQDAVGGPPCVLLAIDLDGFKDVNDVRGHDVGDAVLVEVARRLSTRLRPAELAVRLGGDEFAVLLWASAADAETRAGEILADLARPYDVTVGPVYLSASIGMAGCATTTTVEGLLRNADLALRFAKKRGKNRVEHYAAADDQWLRRRTTIEEALRGAADRGELTLAYQPVVALDEGRAVGVEALVRWHHPTLGSVPPAEFVPVAEEVGLIGELDRWVLREACRQLSRWLADGYDLWVSVNISVRELHLPGYIGQVVDAFVDHGVPPDRLILEVTEHAVAVDVEQMIGRLAALRAVGVRVALDDFGAGYSSLG
ncbi:MAG TPA: EAL domain-containing protein, partial [Micromonosporaceae bacterium]